ncbi:Asp-tRNA(Asn)/Glu-tRNA(Gln) amidotransferase subunit GatB [Mollicutes bacterium LVI A0039]|nr:Asp-tRNA(Asn)/Glu-tRNA(Gln) amidotransferase subunit GatB [Mollicutes bacterium LVI A0039]
MVNYETIIGIEVHAQLNTKRKIFSPSLNDTTSKPNTNIHPIDLGMPGALPRFNEEVLQKAIMVANAFGMDITRKMHWDRKNYFYHDNPKGYQITQQKTPIGRHGKIVLDSGKAIGVDFMHMEEDTAKSLHRDDCTLLDFNRCGVPLVEIVSTPEMRSGAEAREYIEKLREILVYLGVSDGKLEEGSLRIDVNVSVRPYGQPHFNPKVEIKNLNSFSNVEMAIEVERKNQMLAYNTGAKVVQATKRFMENSKTVEIMRVKEGVVDYRFFPEPDLPYIEIDDAYINDVIAHSNKLPAEIKAELKDFGFNDKDIVNLMSNMEMVTFFFKLTEAGLDPKQSLNYLLVNIKDYLNKSNHEFNQIAITLDNFIEIEELIASGKISTNHVKKIIPILCEKPQSAKTLVAELGIEQITDPQIIGQMVDKVLDANEQSIIDFHGGKDRAMGFLIGQIIKESKGQANPSLVNSILIEKLNERKC